MFQTNRAGELARQLQVLKVRTNRSYEALSRRVGVSSSTLHLYRSGEVVPPSYEVIVRFSRACGASREEAEELLRHWTLAVNHPRRRPTEPRWLAAAALVVAVAGLAWHRMTR